MKETFTVPIIIVTIIGAVGVERSQMNMAEFDLARQELEKANVGFDNLALADGHLLKLIDGRWTIIQEAGKHDD